MAGVTAMTVSRALRSPGMLPNPRGHASKPPPRNWAIHPTPSRHTCIQERFVVVIVPTIGPDLRRILYRDGCRPAGPGLRDPAGQ